MVDLAHARRVVDKARAERDVLEGQLVAEKKKLKRLRSNSDAIAKARALLQHAAMETQGHLQARLSTLVSTALDAVFGDQGLDFRITFEPKGGKTHCLLEVGENGVYNHPLDAHGGGVVDVVSFALRMAFWSMQRTRPLLVLDEPMKFVSPDLIPLAADMVKAMSDRLGVQIVMVSHISEFEAIADQVIAIERKGNNSGTRT